MSNRYSRDNDASWRTFHLAFIQNLNICAEDGTKWLMNPPLEVVKANFQHYMSLSRETRREQILRWKFAQSTLILFYPLYLISSNCSPTRAELMLSRIRSIDFTVKFGYQSSVIGTIYIHIRLGVFSRT